MTLISTQKVIFTEEKFRQNHKKLSELVDAIDNRWSEIEKIHLTQTGLTHDGSDLDRILMNGHKSALKAEVNHLIGKTILPGEMAASIPYDVPCFLVLQYTGVAMLAGMPVTLHFAEAAKKVGEIWHQEVTNAGLEGMITIDREMNGREFGRYVLQGNNNIRHFVLAGGAALVDTYMNADMMNLDSVTVFGPTRPKVILMSDLEDKQVENRVKQSVYTAMFDSGQLCALDKEIITSEKHYDLARKTAIKYTNQLIEELKTEEGMKRPYVAPILDKPAFKRGVQILERLKNDPNYEILAGGEVDHEKQYISPTLIEAKNGVDPNIDGFWPYIILNKSENDKHSVERTKEDNTHGGYVWIETNDINYFYSIEKHLLGGHFATIIRNGSILDHSIGQPYGGFNNSLMMIKKVPAGDPDGRVVRLTGPQYAADAITTNPQYVPGPKTLLGRLLNNLAQKM